MSEHVEQINLARARSALDCVRRIRDGKENKLGDDYLNAVEQFPFAARTLGLGQALALLAAAGAKGDENGRQHPGFLRLYHDLQAWLCADEELRAASGCMTVRRPLYKDLSGNSPLVDACYNGGNRGLWYDKLFDEWQLMQLPFQRTV